MGKTVGYSVKERNLIVQSEYASRNQPELYRFLCEHPKVTAIEYDKLSSEEQRLILRSALLVIFETCKQEWRIVKGIGNVYKLRILDTKSEQCQICNAKIRFLYYIRNDISKKELCVGSECIKNYEIDKDNVSDFKAMAAKQLKAQLRIQALHKLNTTYPNIQDYIRNHGNYLRNNTYVLPTEIERQYIRSYQALSNEVTGYLENGDPKALEMIGELYSSIQDQIKEHKVFFERQEANPWALTTALYRSISNLPRHEAAIERLLSDATISWDSLYLFGDAKFRRDILARIAAGLQNSKFKMQRVSPDGGSIYIDFQQGRHIRKLIVYYAEFVSAYGRLLFDSAFVPVSEIEYIAQNTVAVDRQYYRDALSQIERAFPQGVYFYKENGSIEIIDQHVFLVFTESDDGNASYMEIDFSGLISKLYKDYILNQMEPIQQWATARQKSRNKRNDLSDLHDTLVAYRRGLIDDKRTVRRR